jgi:hypothetical protein
MGNPDLRKTPIHLPGNRRAEQDWQDARNERPSETARATPAHAECR